MRRSWIWGHVGAPRWRRIPVVTPVHPTIQRDGATEAEVRALNWSDLDFINHRIHVKRSAEGGVAGPLKDNDSRLVPMNEALASVLAEWRQVSSPAGEEVFPSTGHRGRYVKEHRMHRALRDAEQKIGITGLSWYQSTRHTYASHYVMDGGSLAMLAQRLGHTTTEVTERYAHLQADRITDKERGLVDVDLRHETAPAPSAPASHGTEQARRRQLLN